MGKRLNNFLNDMEKIYLLTDYKGYFESKQKAKPFKSGMDKNRIKEIFHQKGFQAEYLSFSEVDFRNDNYKDKIILYTSSEDPGYYYKDYIEDVILGLQFQGARLIPSYKFLRANNNKVFMEILRDLYNLDAIKNIKSFHIGTIEDLQKKQIAEDSKYVIKTARGAMGKDVMLAANKRELIKKSKLISRTKYLYEELWDIKNAIKHRGFVRSSKYRRKFIVQNFISGLSNDWKILIYYDKYFILRRQNRKDDFRASGSGIIEFVKEIPPGILDFAQLVYKEFDTPHLSIDVAFDGKEFYLIEFQALYFGTKTIEFAPFYFKKKDTIWRRYDEKSNLEDVFVKSICAFLGDER